MFRVILFCSFLFFPPKRTPRIKSVQCFCFSLALRDLYACNLVFSMLVVVLLQQILFNFYAFYAFFSQEMPRSPFSVELDAANATWLSNDVVLLSTKTGELLLLTLVYDGR